MMLMAGAVVMMVTVSVIMAVIIVMVMVAVTVMMTMIIVMVMVAVTVMMAVIIVMMVMMTVPFVIITLRRNKDITFFRLMSLFCRGDFGFSGVERGAALHVIFKALFRHDIIIDGAVVGELHGLSLILVGDRCDIVRL